VRAFAALIGRHLSSLAEDLQPFPACDSDTSTAESESNSDGCGDTAWRPGTGGVILWRMWWNKKPVPEKTLRERLIDERSALMRQVANFELGPRRPRLSRHSSQFAPLMAAIAKIDQQIAALDSDEA
jgi:hypothetical protein